MQARDKILDSIQRLFRRMRSETEMKIESNIQYTARALFNWWASKAHTIYSHTDTYTNWHTLTRLLNTVAFNLRTNDLILPYFIEITFFYIVCSLKNLLCGMKMLFKKCAIQDGFFVSFSRRSVYHPTIFLFVLAKTIEQWFDFYVYDDYKSQ